MSNSNSPDPNKELPNHEYDGIHELNHPAPFWWQALFFLTIVFGAAYFAYYQLGEGKTLLEDYREAWSRVQILQSSLVQQNGPDLVELTKLAQDPTTLAHGKAAFGQRCVSCHAADGGGGIGPNLTDQYWLHGDGQLIAIYTTIRDGVAEKGMPPWGPIVSPDELKALTVFVRSLHGTHPAAPKAPQGVAQTYP